jgi:ubiquinone/menaquinone biosynthesis C-methylase UbiE
LHYSDSKFDGVIISNALHIMPNPQNALENIRRVLKDDGLLIAPTYLRTKRFGEKIKVLIGRIIGFKTYSKWTTHEYLQFLSQNGWDVQSSEVFKAMFPLMFVSAVKSKESKPQSQQECADELGISKQLIQYRKNKVLQNNQKILGLIFLLWAF